MAQGTFPFLPLARVHKQAQASFLMHSTIEMFKHTVLITLLYSIVGRLQQSSFCVMPDMLNLDSNKTPRS